jgi:hypothetical protein
MYEHVAGHMLPTACEIKLQRMAKPGVAGRAWQIISCVKELTASSDQHVTE